MSFDLWLVYLLASLALSLTPGPNGLLCLNHGVRYGLGRTVFTALGCITGMALLIGASLAGLGALMLTSEMLFSVVKWVGRCIMSRAQVCARKCVCECKCESAYESE